VSRSAIRKGGEEAFIIDLSGTLDKGKVQEFRSCRSSGVQEGEESGRHQVAMEYPSIGVLE
jgi:hypothetical protein